MLARLLQFFAPGIPQLYYVGLLAGRNAPELAASSGDHRHLNRRRYTEAEVVEALRQPVVGALVELVRFRGRHPAFGGTFTLLDAPAGEVAMRWAAPGGTAELHARLADAAFRLVVTGEPAPGAALLGGGAGPAQRPAG